MSKRSQEGNPSQQEDVSKRSRKVKKGQSSKGQSSKERLPRFFSDDAEARYNDFSSPATTNKIVSCFHLRESSIEDLGLNIVLEIFGDLRPYLTCDELICNQTLWEFYANLENIGADLTSRINHKDISINASKIRSAFGLASDSTALNPYYATTWPDDDWCEQNNFDLVELSQNYFKVQWHKKISCKKEYKPMNLDPIPRLVFELMWLLLTNSSGHSSEPTISQVMLFFALMQRRKINYARYLMNHLAYAHLKRQDFPCGNLVMRVLKHLKVKSPKAPIIATYMECKEVTKDFFKNKKVEYNRLTNVWQYKVPKNPPYKSSQGEGSSNLGGEDFEARIQRAIERAQAPLLEKVTESLDRIESLERAFDKSLVLQSTLIDEMDVLRQSKLMEMDDESFNKIVAYRKDLETQRIAKMGQSAKNLRSEALRSSRINEEGSSEGTQTHNPSDDS